MQAPALTQLMLYQLLPMRVFSPPAGAYMYPSSLSSFTPLCCFVQVGFRCEQVVFSCEQVVFRCEQDVFMCE